MANLSGAPSSRFLPTGPKPDQHTGRRLLCFPGGRAATNLELAGPQSGSTDSRKAGFDELQASPTAALQAFGWQNISLGGALA